MSLILTTYNTPGWQTFINMNEFSLVDSAHLSSAEKAPVVLKPAQSLTQVIALLSTIGESQHIWLGVVQAEHYIAYAMKGGQSVSEAANDWQAVTTELLALKRQRRQKITLFNLEHALAQPLRLYEKMGLIHLQPTSTDHTAEESLALLAACQYIAQQENLQQLNTYLYASAISLGCDEKPRIDVEMVMKKQREEIIQLRQAEKERNIVLPELLVLQEKIEEQHLSLIAEINRNKENEELNTQLNEQHRQIIENLTLTHSEKINELSSHLQEAKHEIEAKEHTILAHEKQHKKEVLKLEETLSQLKAKASYAEYNSSLLSQEVTAIKNSKLWKSTAPVRRLGRIIKRVPHSQVQLTQEAALLLTSEYFDVEWYTKNYPDVAESAINPALHYLLFGAAEGRLPGPLFDGNWYMQQYPDIAESNTNPLLHFIMFGQAEGRKSSPALLTSDKENNEDKING